jgi:RNA polymerase sigma-70 factor, ECF subfamily
MQLNNPNNALHDAFMQLYEPAHNRLCRFVQTIVWNKDDAKDIISETALIAFKNFSKINSPEKFVYYLFGVASNLTKKNNFKKKLLFWVDDLAHLNEPQIFSSERADAKRDLDKLLSKIPYKQAQAIVLYEINGFSYDEIALIQEVKIGAVKSRILRARIALKKLAQQELAQYNKVHNKTAVSMVQPSNYNSK